MDLWYQTLLVTKERGTQFKAAQVKTLQAIKLKTQDCMQSKYANSSVSNARREGSDSHPFVCTG